ncbi:Uncharacterised protein [uncultured archaeon]|nr:Uncharacterised protein [uncultured archaeon]
MVKFSFNYLGKSFNIEAKECRSFLSQGTGLMFRKKSKPLLFLFNKKNRNSIHSFFCSDFIIVWFDGNTLIDIKYVKPWKINIKPIKRFDKFLEIPETDINFKKLKLLIIK